MKEKVRLGLIGLGERGKVLLEGALLPMYDMDVEVCAVCDVYEDRVQHAVDMIKEKTGKQVAGFTEYKRVLEQELDAVIISTAWEAHVEIALEAMKAGKYVGLEVGGVFAMETGYWEDNDSIFLDGKHNEYEFRQKEIWDNASEYEEEYIHPLWKDLKPLGGHDGLDWMVIRAFV